MAQERPQDPPPDPTSESSGLHIPRRWVRLIAWALLGVCIPFITLMLQIRPTSTVLTPGYPSAADLWFPLLYPFFLLPPLILYAYYGWIYQHTVCRLQASNIRRIPVFKWGVLLVYPVLAGVATSWTLSDFVEASPHDALRKMALRGLTRAVLPLTVAILGMLIHQLQHQRNLKKLPSAGSLDVASDVPATREPKLLQNIWTWTVVGSFIPLTLASYSVVAERNSYYEEGIGLIVISFIIEATTQVVPVIAIFTALGVGYRLVKSR